MSKKISFLNFPFTFAGFDDEIIVAKTLKHCVKQVKMVVPVIAETGNVINKGQVRSGPAYRNKFDLFLSGRSPL